MQANTREEAKHQTKYSKNRDVLHGLIFQVKPVTTVFQSHSECTL